MEGVLLTAGLIPMLKSAALTLAVTAAVVYSLIFLFRNNRLLFWCLLLALGGHITFAGGIFAANFIISHRPQEVRIAVNVAQFRPPKVEPEKKKEEFKPLDLPLGSLTGNRKAKKMPKGTRLDVKKGGRTGEKAGPGKPLFDRLVASGTIPVDSKDEGLFTGDLQDVINASDIRSIASGGLGGENGGTPDGEGNGDVPAGFPEGKIGGRVYFIRLKHGSGAWNAYDDGTRRLLGYLNQFFPCESESRAMTSAEMRERYMTKGAQPCFLYLYADDTFSLSGTDVAVLRDYMERGGFLFIDSRPDTAIKDRVASELSKVLPGQRLADLKKSHPINSFLFKLPVPPVGENVVTGVNYGITDGGRLVVFYTMGNFSHLFAANAPGSMDYVTGQYQMGANVMLYAIRKGNAEGIAKRSGVKASIATLSSNDMERLGWLEPTKPATERKPDESVKVKPTPQPGTDPNADPPEPDEIKVIE